MDEFAYHIKVPKERIAVLIGKQGETKKKIEDETRTKIDVDSKEGVVTVSGEDAILLYSTRDIIKAIGRGFNPEVAMQLIKQDYIFDVIILPDQDKKNHLQRVKGRIIGKEGKSRALIEEYTDTFISVFGKTIAIIGRAEDVPVSRKAIEMLIMGSPHSNVYKWLERRKADKFRMEFEGNSKDNFETTE